VGASEGRAIGEALIEHPAHELFDEAAPGEIAMVERLLRVRLPPSFRALLEVGGGAILEDGDLLLGTKDPEGFGGTLHDVARALWEEGLPRHLLPIVDGARFVCLDLDARDEAGECEVVELDADSFEELRRWPDFPTFARAVLLR